MSEARLPFRNEFSWSFSRAQTFHSCRRRYWFRYYAAWGGWMPTAPEESRQLYLLSKMRNLPMLVGTIVHSTLEHQLVRMRDAWLPQDPVREVRQRFEEAWRDSAARRHREVGPKSAPPLFEHHYGIHVPSARVEAMRERAERSVRNVLASELYAQILAAGVSHWQAIEDVDTFRIDGVPVFVSPDFVFEREGQLWLVDWKTGRARRDMPLQLQLYALWAQRIRGWTPDRIRAVDYFVADDEVHEVPVDAELLRGLQTRISRSIGRMREVLIDPEQNLTRAEDHPGTKDETECGGCFFWEVCTVRRGPGPGANAG